LRDDVTRHREVRTIAPVGQGIHGGDAAHDERGERAARQEGGRAAQPDAAWGGGGRQVRGADRRDRGSTQGGHGGNLELS
jgi:hypothetical protein